MRQKLEEQSASKKVPIGYSGCVLRCHLGLSSGMYQWNFEQVLISLKTLGKGGMLSIVQLLRAIHPPSVHLDKVLVASTIFPQSFVTGVQH